jgi:hypothetical protein
LRALAFVLETDVDLRGCVAPCGPTAEPPTADDPSTASASPYARKS